MTEKTDKLKITDRYEYSAFETTVSVWKCKHCSRTHNYEDLARRCCALDIPCASEKCNNRIRNKNRGYTSFSKHLCSKCLQKEKDKKQQAADERWAARERRPWDGNAMLYSDTLDKYFYDLDGIWDYVKEDDEEDVDDYYTLEELRLIICRPTRPYQFNLSEYLADYLPDDDYGDCHLPGNWEEVEKIVNDYLDNNTFSWEPGPYALDLKSIKSCNKENYVSPFDGTQK